MSKLVGPRKNINEIDKRIITLLNDRARVAKYIGKLKKEAGASVYTPEREVEIYENIIKENKGPMPNKALFAIYREIMSGSLGLEKKLKIAYLGPEATFTHQAAIKKFGASVSYFPCANISDVFAEVERGRSDYGVVPVENSTEGAVNYTLDMFIESNLKICAELYLAIHHYLLSNAASLKTINQIYSIPQALAQCRLWLESNLPAAKLMPTSSTAEAARYVAEHPQFKNEIACVASHLAAKEYRLKTLAPSIADNATNIFRRNSFAAR